MRAGQRPINRRKQFWGNALHRFKLPWTNKPIGVKEAVKEALVNNSRDTRSAQARAYAWASRIMTVSLEMVVPGLLGFWADNYFGTRAVFTIVGFVGGMCLGMWHLLRMVGIDNHE